MQLRLVVQDRLHITDFWIVQVPVWLTTWKTWSSRGFDEDWRRVATLHNTNFRLNDRLYRSSAWQMNKSSLKNSVKHCPGNCLGLFRRKKHGSISFILDYSRWSGSYDCVERCAGLMWINSTWCTDAPARSSVKKCIDRCSLKHYRYINILR